MTQPPNPADYPPPGGYPPAPDQGGYTPPAPDQGGYPPAPGGATHRLHRRVPTRPRPPGAYPPPPGSGALPAAGGYPPRPGLPPAAVATTRRPAVTRRRRPPRGIRAAASGLRRSCLQRRRGAVVGLEQVHQERGPAAGGHPGVRPDRHRPELIWSVCCCRPFRPTTVTAYDTGGRRRRDHHAVLDRWRNRRHAAVQPSCSWWSAARSRAPISAACSTSPTAGRCTVGSFFRPRNVGSVVVASLIVGVAAYGRHGCCASCRV